MIRYAWRYSATAFVKSASHALVFSSVAAVTFAVRADARVVKYLYEKPAILAAAEDQGIEGPFSDMPSFADTPVQLDNAMAADHVVKTISVYCRAYKIENPVSGLLQNMLATADKSVSEPVSHGAILHIISGSSLLRCMGKNELQTICKNTVVIKGSLRIPRHDGSMKETPLSVSVERNGRVGGFCGNIARYTAIVSREAVISLFQSVKEHLLISAAPLPEQEGHIDNQVNVPIPIS